MPVELQIHVTWIDIAERKYSLDDGGHIWDFGAEITTDVGTQTSIATMFAIADAKGWSQIEVDGSEEFKLSVWLEARRRGIKVTNYSPPAAALATLGEASAEPSSLPIALASEANNVARSAAFDSTRTGTARNDHAGRSNASAAGPRTERPTGELIEAANRFGAAVRRNVSKFDRSEQRKRYAEELDELKRFVDLRLLVQRYGYRHDPRASDKNHWVSRNDTGRKLIVGKSAGGHWVWSDNSDRHGSAIDFLISEGMDFRSALQILKGLDKAPSLPTQNAGAPKPTVDAAELAAEWSRIRKEKPSAYLLSRGIRSSTMLADRFRGCWGVDGRNNAVFPYSSERVLVGLERRNRPSPGLERSFKAYSAGGKPGVWQSRTSRNDTEIVIVESPIDAMAHYQLCDPQRRRGIRYLAIRNGTAADAILALMRPAPVGAIITVATDSDAAGEEYYRRILAFVGNEWKIERERPSAKDWAEQLKAGPNPSIDSSENSFSN